MDEKTPRETSDGDRVVEQIFLLSMIAAAMFVAPVFLIIL